MDPHLCIGIDVGCKARRVGIATPDGSILEEFDISHTDAGFQGFPSSLRASTFMEDTSLFVVRLNSS